jgi:hypothetical protein
MILSERTVSILKNFATINPSILIREGSDLRTISPQKTILARVQVEEDFPQDFAISDLSKFLSVLSLFQSPELEFGEKALTIKSAQQKLTYFYADVSTFVSAPATEIKFPKTDVEFDLKAADLQKVLRAGQVLQLPEFIFGGDGETVSVRAGNFANPTADSFSIELGETPETFQAIFKLENAKMLHFDYTVSLSSKGISRFVNETEQMTYWLAVEKDSTFGQ